MNALVPNACACVCVCVNALVPNAVVPSNPSEASNLIYSHLNDAILDV